MVLFCYEDIEEDPDQLNTYDGRKKINFIDSPTADW